MQEATTNGVLQKSFSVKPVLPVNTLNNTCEEIHFLVKMQAEGLEIYLNEPLKGFFKVYEKSCITAT